MAHIDIEILGQRLAGDHPGSPQAPGRTTAVVGRVPAGAGPRSRPV